MKKKQMIIYVAIVLVCLIALVSTTFAYFTKTLVGERKVSMKVGTLDVTFDGGNVINLANATPITDTVGLRQDPYTFTITNTGTVPAYYIVYFEEDINNTLSNSLVRYSLTGTNGYSSGLGSMDATQLVSAKSDSTYFLPVVVPSGTLEVGESVTYTLHMWLSYFAGNEAQGKTYKNRIIVQNSSAAINSVGSEILR